MRQDAHRSLLSDRTADLYRTMVAAGVDRVAERVAKVDRPFTGIAPNELADAVARIDLDQPLGDATAALDELGRVYLDDAVLNMGFLRGLSAAYMKGTPAINDWLTDRFRDDEVLAACRFGLLREQAAIGYHHEHFEAATEPGSPYLKMLAALWRESPAATLGRRERLATMASLLHVDHQGRPLVSALIARSPLEPVPWLRRYLHAYLRPLLHCFYEYDLAFMPHGENVILVLEDDVPRRVLMKDLAEEIVLMNAATPVPPEVERVRDPGSGELNALAILTDVFDCFFRFLAATLVSDDVLSEEEFWSAVADCVSDYQRDMPHLVDRFRRYDLFAETFPLSCLNRLQLRNNRQMINLQRPTEQLQLVGTLDNPIAAFKPADSSVA